MGLLLLRPTAKAFFHEPVKGCEGNSSHTFFYIHAKWEDSAAPNKKDIIKKKDLIMKRVFLFLICLFTALIAVAQEYYREGEVIVKFKSQAGIITVQAGTSAGRSKIPPVKSKAVSNVLQQLGASEVKPLMPLTGVPSTRANVRGRSNNKVEQKDLSQLCLLKFDKNKGTVEDVIKMLKQLDDVEYAEPNFIVRALGESPKVSPSLPLHNMNLLGEAQSYNDPGYSEQWGLEAINMPALWEKPNIHSRRPVIAILDTGVDINHPDLADNIWTNEAEQGNDEDGNGYVGDFHGWSFIAVPDISDPNNHGTHCAGIAAAVGGNGEGIVGANPDALIMPVKVLYESGEGDVSDIIQGIDYAIANGADVLSMSYGYACPYGPSEAERDALLEASHSAILVAAAGNNGVCMNPGHQGLHSNPEVTPAPCYPAAFTFVIGVQASTKEGGLASFSNFDCGITPPVTIPPGTEPLSYELIAPGDSIISTVSGGGYELMSGTSMACPLVAGAISSLIQKRNFNSNQELLTTLAVASQGGNIDMSAAYDLTELPQHQINEVFTDNVDGVDVTFKVKSVTTVQVGDGENAAVGQGVTNLVIPEQVNGFTVTSVGRRAFSWTDIENVTLPNTLIYLDNEAFSVAEHLNAIDIPRNVVEIGGSAFACCGIKELYIPETVRSIGGGAFSSCANLNSIIIDEKNPRYDSRNNCNAIIETATKTLTVGTSAIPEGVECIGSSAFANRPMETIVIPNTVKIISVGAFAYCENLKEINIPESVTTIDVAAFEGCIGLTSVYIPKSVTYMWTPFIACDNLTSFVIDPENPVYDSRDNCNAIIRTSTNSLLWGFNCTRIPDGITSIGTEGASSFARCNKLDSVTITKDITYIGPGIFISCDNLNSIVVVDENPVYDSRENCNAIIETATNTLIFGNHASTIPSSVKTIGYIAFSGTFFDNQHIVFPEGLEKICCCAYSYFYNTILSIPSTIKEIESDAFRVYDEGMISEVYCYRKTPLTISNYVFRAVSTATLHVPKGQKAAYENARGWKDFGTIVEMDVEGADPPIKIEPIVESEETAFGSEKSFINEETDLTNVVIDNAYYVMDAGKGNGFNGEVQALVLNSTTTEKQMSIVQESEVGDEAIQKNYSGIIFEVQAGSGTITIDAQTFGTHMLNVQVGRDEPQVITNIERSTVDVTYSVLEPTYVYIYASLGKKDAANALRALHVGENVALLYGYKVFLDKADLMGDVNGDGMVDVVDAVATINSIMGNQSSTFHSAAADYNVDGVVDVFDVMNIINNALNNKTKANGKVMALGNKEERADATATSDGVLFGINNVNRFTAFQFDVEVADGMELTNVRLTANTTHHSLHYVKNGKNIYRVVGISMDNSILTSEESGLVKLSFSKGGNVRISNIFFVSPQEEKVCFASCNAIVTGISSIEREEVERVFDLFGRNVDFDHARQTKGIYIINNKKVVK